MGTMTFGDVIEALKSGHRVSREGWNGKGMWLALQVPDEHSKMRLPYIYMSTAHGELVPWMASQSDMLSSDWSILKREIVEHDGSQNCAGVLLSPDGPLLIRGNRP